MELHHIGYLVDSIEKGIEIFAPTISHEQGISGVFTIDDQQVKVCFLDLGKEVYLELVEPVEGNKSLKKLKKKGVGCYHLGFLTLDLEREIEQFEAKDFKHISTFSSPAFEGRNCAFLLSPDFQLLELIQS